jgi:hypothetical protein
MTQYYMVTLVNDKTRESTDCFDYLMTHEQCCTALSKMSRCARPWLRRLIVARNSGEILK